MDKFIGSDLEKESFLSFLIESFARQFKKKYGPIYHFTKTFTYKQRCNFDSKGKNAIRKWKEKLDNEGMKACKLCLTGYSKNDEQDYCERCRRLPLSICKKLQEWVEREDERVLNGKDRRNPDIISSWRLLSTEFQPQCKGCGYNFIPEENNQKFCEMCQLSVYQIHEALKNKINENRTPYCEIENIKIPIDTLVDPSFHDYDLVLELIFRQDKRVNIKELEGYEEGKTQYLKWCKYCRKPFLTTNYRKQYHSWCLRHKKTDDQRERRRKQHLQEKENRSEARKKARKKYGSLMDHHNTGKGTGSLGQHANPNFEKEHSLVKKELRRIRF